MRCEGRDSAKTRGKIGILELCPSILTQQVNLSCSATDLELRMILPVKKALVSQGIQSADYDQVQRFLRDLLKILSAVFIIINALDEAWTREKLVLSSRISALIGLHKPECALAATSPPSLGSLSTVLISYTDMIWVDSCSSARISKRTSATWNWVPGTMTKEPKSLVMSQSTQVA